MTSSGVVESSQSGRNGVEIVERMLDALNDRRLLELLRIFDPETVIETPLLNVWNLEGRGHSLVREWVARIQAEWAFLEARDYRLESKGEWVVGQARARGRGKASATELSWDLYFAIRVVGGRIVRMGAYLNEEQALAAFEEFR